MAVFLARRLIGLVVMLVCLHAGVFWAMELIPGSQVDRQLGEHASAEARARLEKKLGLDRPAWERYLRSAAATFGRLDLQLEADGVHRVSERLRSRFPATFELTLVAMCIATLVGLVLGVLAAAFRGTIVDLLAMTGATFGVAMPIFWLGLMLLLIASVNGWPYLGGGLGRGVHHGLSTDFVLCESLLRGRWELLGESLARVALPAITLATVPLAFIVRMTRASLVDVLGEDYIRTARAKGLTPRAVMLRHALRNALVPIVTIVGLQLGYLLGGAVITETVFDWKGLGTYIVERAIAQDGNAVGGGVFFIATIFLLVSTLVDLSYALIDPRIRDGGMQ